MEGIYLINDALLIVALLGLIVWIVDKNLKSVLWAMAICALALLGCWLSSFVPLDF